MTQKYFKEKYDKEKKPTFKTTEHNQDHILPGMARIGYVFNKRTQLFDIETVVTSKNKQGQFWCENVPVMEFNEKGKLVETEGAWIDSDLIKFK